MNSINAKKGLELNSLEKTFLVLDKILSQKIEEGKKGVVLCKGKPNETKISYKEAKKLLSSLRDFFGASGAFSLGVCETCTKYNFKAYSSGNFGECEGKMVHRFHSCEHHSKSGGGYGV